MDGRTIWLVDSMMVGADRGNLRSAEVVGEGARLGQRSLRLASGDAAPSLEDDTRRDFIKTSIVIMLAALLVWLIFLIFMLPD